MYVSSKIDDTFLRTIHMYPVIGAAIMTAFL